MEDFRFDGHKLHYHVSRVNDWLLGKNIYPIYVETSPSGACNHRCRFCGLDFMGYQRRFLDWGIFRERMAEMGRLGVKSMAHAGEGEPLLHDHFEDMVQYGKECGIDQALSTNGVLLVPSRAEKIMPFTEWIRISLDAGTAKTYAFLHRTKPEDFERVLDNLTEAVRMRDAKAWRCTLGIQMLLLPENRAEIALLAEKARSIGVDYLSIKPYSQHPQSHTTGYSNISYEEDLQLQKDAEAFSSERFRVVFRAAAMKKWDESKRTYHRCRALPFWTYIDAGGNVWACSVFMGDDRFLLGNICEENFEQIWEGERRRKVMEWVENEWDTCQCRVNCRMDEVNRYLWSLENPPDHANFI